MPGPMTTTPRSGTTGATPATTSSTGISSTRRMCRSSAARMRWPPGHCTTRTPTPPSPFNAAPRSANRCRSTTSSRWPMPGTWGRTTGRSPSAYVSPMIRPTCWRWKAKPIRTRAIRRPLSGCRRTRLSRVSTPCSSSPFCVVTRCRWTRLRRAYCVGPPPPARRARRSFGLRAVVGVRVRAHAGAVVKAVDGIYVFCGQLEIEDVQVAGDPLGFGRSEYDRVAQLHVPPQQHLCGCLAVFAGDRGHGRVVVQPAENQRGVGLGDDVVLRVCFAHVVVIEQGVQLDLVDGRRDEGQVDDRRQVIVGEVGHADRA